MSDRKRRQYVVGIAQILALFVVYLIALTIGSGLTWPKRALARLGSGAETIRNRLSRKRRRPRKI